MKKQLQFILILIFITPLSSIAQWGYTYDSTKVYLDQIRKSPFVTVASIGKSVEQRDLWMVTIMDTSSHFDQMYRVVIHARTHPGEVSSQWLTQRIIDQLIGDSDIAKAVRYRVVFNIVPMYNPDGVELVLPRENAHGIDLERNWFAEIPEPECAALKAKYLELMNSFVPIRIALNMHMDSGADSAYFFFHLSDGTSAEYAEDEKHFITGVKKYWTEGIANWDYQKSWGTGNPMLFPESWFWFNYQQSVMALTFEETRVSTRYDASLDSAAYAILFGIRDYLELPTSADERIISSPTVYNLEQNYPNPFNPNTTIQYALSTKQKVSLKVFDLLGREVALLVNEEKEPGTYSVKFDASELASGTYIYRINAGSFSVSRKLMLLK